MIDLTTLTIEKAHTLLMTKELTVRELVDVYLKEIEKNNTRLNAYLEIYDDIDEQISVAEKLFQENKATQLTGIPFALKDNILFKDHKVSAASKILEGYTATYDSTVVERLRKEGVIFLGRTNMDEFAMGSSTETSAYGITRNPLDEDYVPGGSSGGSASAVASNMALVALGSETCGSIRQPSAFCGLVGFKPTYGAVSRYGLIAMGSSLDQIGPFGKTVSDVEIIHTAMSAHDPHDATSVPENARTYVYGAAKKKIGVPVECFDEGIDPEIRASFSRSLDVLRSFGYEIVELSLTYLKYSLPVYYILMPAESSTNLARFDGMRYGPRVEKSSLLETYLSSRGEGFGREVRRRILLGTYVLSHGYYDAYYGKAIKVRDAITKEMKDAFNDVDFIVTPTTPTLPFKFGEKMSNPIAMYMSDIFSAPANLSGCPAIALPSDKEGNFYHSIQITAPWWGEDRLFTISKAWESRK
jgi:aspartyl-tRNA(Asn)/glutamyl-tRNA(Gln) amidotransferase subunit A